MKLNKLQQRSLHLMWTKNNQGLSYLQFRRTVEPAIGIDCAMVEWGNMWLGIETDGYTHS